MHESLAVGNHRPTGIYILKNLAGRAVSVQNRISPFPSPHSLPKRQKKKNYHLKSIACEF